MEYINSLLEIPFLKISFWNNTILEYIIAVGVYFLSLIILNIFKFSVLSKLKHLSTKTNTDWDDILIETIDSIKLRFYSFVSFEL